MILITNFRSEEEPIFREAIKRYGDDILYIDKNAYNIYGDKVSYLYALKCRKETDLSSFWRLFEQVKEDFITERKKLL